MHGLQGGILKDTKDTVFGHGKLKDFEWCTFAVVLVNIQKKRHFHSESKDPNQNPSNFSFSRQSSKNSFDMICLCIWLPGPRVVYICLSLYRAFFKEKVSSVRDKVKANNVRSYKPGLESMAVKFYSWRLFFYGHNILALRHMCSRFCASPFAEFPYKKHKSSVVFVNFVEPIPVLYVYIKLEGGAPRIDWSCRVIEQFTHLSRHINPTAELSDKAISKLCIGQAKVSSYAGKPIWLRGLGRFLKSVCRKICHFLILNF